MVVGISEVPIKTVDITVEVISLVDVDEETTVDEPKFSFYVFNIESEGPKWEHIESVSYLAD